MFNDLNHFLRRSHGNRKFSRVKEMTKLACFECFFLKSQVLSFSFLMFKMSKTA